MKLLVAGSDRVDRARPRSASACSNDQRSGLQARRPQLRFDHDDYRERQTSGGCRQDAKRLAAAYRAMSQRRDQPITASGTRHREPRRACSGRRPAVRRGPGRPPEYGNGRRVSSPGRRHSGPPSDCRLPMATSNLDRRFERPDSGDARRGAGVGRRGYRSDGPGVIESYGDVLGRFRYRTRCRCRRRTRPSAHLRRRPIQQGLSDRTGGPGDGQLEERVPNVVDLIEQVAADGSPRSTASSRSDPALSPMRTTTPTTPSACAFDE